MTTMQTASATSSAPRTGGPPRPPRPGAAPPRPAAAATAVDPVRVVRQYFWWIALSVVVGAFLGAAAHFIFAWTSPVYSASTYWEVNVPKREEGSVGESANVTGEQMDRSIATAAAIMTGTNVLRPAITSPEVRQTEWIRRFMDSSQNIQIDNALADLQDRLRTSYGNSLLIQLRITGGNKEDLVKILTAINAEYLRELNLRKQNELYDVEGSFTAEKEKLRTTIQTLTSEIASRIEKDKINLDVSNSDQAMALALIREAINQRTAELSMVTASLAAAEQRLNESTLTFNDAERAAARQDPSILRLEGEVVQLRTELRNSLQRFGSEHLSIKRLQERLAATETEFETELDSVMRRNFLSQVESSRNAARSLQQILAQLEQDRLAADARHNDLLKAVEWVNAKKAELAAAQEQLVNLEAVIRQAVMVAGMERTLQARLAQRPEADARPVFPNLLYMVPLGVVLVGGLTTAGLFLRELTDRRVRGPGCVAMLPHGKVLGLVPHREEDRLPPARAELAVVDTGRSVIAESIRHLFAPLSRRMNEGALHSVLVIGGQAGSGATTVLSNLAASFAGSERTVLVIDGNFRRPRLAEVFAVAEGPGLGDVLSGAATFDQGVQDCRVEKVSVMTAGSDGNRSVDLLSTPRLSRVLAEAGQKFDVVLVDAPAAVVAGDWQVLANHVDATILVVRAMQEERGLVSRLIGQLREARPEHLGVVVNAVRSNAGGYMKRNLRQMEDYQKTAKRTR